MSGRKDVMMAEVAERVVFSSFEFKHFPNGMCQAEVELEQRGGEKVVGTANGTGSGVGSMRAAAMASVAALEKAVPAGPKWELLGVKSTIAFDSTIVIVAIAARTEDGPIRLVGSYVTDDDRERAAAVAVLNATNRYLEKDMFTRS